MSRQRRLQSAGFTLIELLGAILLIALGVTAALSDGAGLESRWGAIGYGVFFGGNVGSFGWDVRDRLRDGRGGLAVPALCALVALVAGWLLIPQAHRTAGLISMGVAAGLNVAVLNFMRNYEATQQDREDT